IMLAELLQPAPIGLAHAAVGVEELDDELGRLRVGDAVAELIGGLVDLALARLEIGPMLDERLRGLAPPQRILPFPALLVEFGLHRDDRDGVVLAHLHVTVERLEAGRELPESNRRRAKCEDGADGEEPQDLSSHTEGKTNARRPSHRRSPQISPIPYWAT